MKVLIFSALCLLLSFSAAKPENDSDLCTMEIIAVGENREEQTIVVIGSIENALPEVFPPFAVNSTEELEEVLPSLYESVAEEFNERPSESGYTEFVEALTEIMAAYTEACSGETVLQVNELVQSYVNLTRSNESNTEERRDVFGKMLCLQDQEAIARRRRQICSCKCPEGGLESGIFQCSCQVFNCLDPDDDLKPLFGFNAKARQSLGMVVDTTGSMADEIEAAKAVMTNLIAREEDVDIGSYVLTPFNDYGNESSRNFGPSIIAFADQPDEVQSLVLNITGLFAHGGGDCPEYALDAILLTLSATDPDNPSKSIMVAGSQIVVLTDAGTINPELETEIVNRAKTLGVCIHFLFSPYCCCETGRELYEQIAGETGGIVIDSLSDDNATATLDEFVKFYQENPCMASRGGRARRQEASDDGYSDERMCHSFNVSSLTAVLKLVVNTIQPEVTVSLPTGSTISILVVNEYGSLFLSTPESGAWSACVSTGTFRYTVNAEVDIDILISYIVEDEEGTREVSATSTALPACYTSKVAVVSTRAEDISSAVLLLIDDDDHTLATVELSKCGENSLIGSLTAPLGFVTYRLEGNDEDGIPFVYGTRRTATFSEGGYVFTTLGEVDVGIEESDSLILLYRIQNTDVQGYASLEFTAVAESSGQYSISVEPEYAVLEAGMSIDVTVSAVANSSTVEPGTGAILFVSASDGCASVTSEFYNVTIKSSSDAHGSDSVLTMAIFIGLGGTLMLITNIVVIIAIVTYKKQEYKGI